MIRKARKGAVVFYTEGKVGQYGLGGGDTQERFRKGW
jgi:hypothetical protein